MIGARLRRPLASVLAVAAVTLGIQIAAAPAANAATWTTQSSGTTVGLSGVSCPTVYTCYASGDGGTILRTVDGGTTWTTVRSGGPYQAFDISCPTTATCYAADTYDIIRTVDGGLTWSTAHASTFPLYAISCATVTTCVAAGYQGKVVATANGTTWSAGASTTPYDLRSVECPTAATCWSGGWGGRVQRSTDGGLTWTHHTTASPNQVDGVGCSSTTNCWAAFQSADIEMTTGGAFTPQTGAYDKYDVGCGTTGTCWAVGYGGAISTNASGSWAAESSPTGNGLRRIACPGPATCFAVGGNGTIVATGATPPPVPCSDGLSVLDGYVLGAYARLALTASPGGTTICYQLNSAEGSESGTIQVSGASLTAPLPTIDDNAEACAGSNAIPGPHPIVDATLQGSTRVMLDVRTDAGVADVCLQVGSLTKHVRVTVPGVSAPVPGVTPDVPARPTPPRYTGPVGYPSASCTGGIEIVNALVAGTRVKARVTQPNALRLDVCARAADVGGRVSIDLSGVTDVVPTVAQGSDMATCPVPQISVVSPTVLEVKTSAPGLPLSVCIRTAAGVQTFTVTGGSVPNVVPVLELDPA